MTTKRDRRSAEAVAREFSRTLAAEANEFDDTVTLGVEHFHRPYAEMLHAASSIHAALTPKEPSHGE